MNLPREWQLLVAAAKLQPSTADRDQVEKELAGRHVNWDRVVDYAYQHDIAPLIYRTLARLSDGDAAPAAFERLKAAFLANAVRNAVLFRELQKLLRALREGKIPVVVLKGAALAETVYGDRALRPMSDVDLLIRKENLNAVERLLGPLGYALDENQQNIKEWYFTHYYHLVFSKKVSSSFTVCFEIHWHLERPTRRFLIDTEAVWKRAVPARIADVPAL